MPTMLRYCNDYYGKIWLNGKPIVPAMRGPAQKYEFVEVTLQKGENVILVKTSPGSAGGDGRRGDYQYLRRNCREREKVTPDDPPPA